MPKEYFQKQKQVVSEHIKTQDVIIATALIPGRVAPVLISKEMVASLHSGAVIVDLAVEAGGNCEISRLGEVIETANGVKIIGHVNVPGRLAEDASSLFARNLFNFISPHVDKDSREHFETRTHRRIIDIYSPSAKTIDALMKLDLPSGVDIEVKL